VRDLEEKRRYSRKGKKTHSKRKWMCKLKKKDVREFFFEGKDVRESKKKENRWSDYIKKKNWSLEKRRSDRGRKQNLLGHGN